MADTDTGKPTPIGDNLVRAVEELRAARGLSLRQLSERLGASGHPLLTSAVHSLVQGKRRPDADDVVALALALGVNPNALLLPRHVGVDDIIELAPRVRQRAGVTWSWADGRLALPGELVPEGTKEVFTPGDKFADFLEYSRPDYAPQPDPAVAELMTLARMIELVLGTMPAAEQARVWEHWRDTILRRFRLAAIQLEELFARFDGHAAAAGELRDAAGSVREAAVPFTDAHADRYREGARAGRDAVRDPFGERPT